MSPIRWPRMLLLGVLAAAVSFCVHQFIVGPMIPNVWLNFTVAIVDGLLIGTALGRLTYPWVTAPDRAPTHHFPWTEDQL